jgi:hypothetical protein
MKRHHKAKRNASHSSSPRSHRKFQPTHDAKMDADAKSSKYDASTQEETSEGGTTPIDTDERL